MSDRPILPPRALTALQLSADGLERSEVAALMSISRQGVSSALTTARNKLEANTTEHAIARALRRGLIT